MLDENTTRHSPAGVSMENSTESLPPVTTIEELEHRLASARPRLMRLARARGLSADRADEAAQEALVEAWRHLEGLRAPDRFDAWLDGICRNVCRRLAHSAAMADARLVPLMADEGEGEEDAAPLDLPDLSQPDLAEELSRRDLHVLIDHALGALPASARESLMLRYLDELPQREAAERLGLTISALEARLHRARTLLRRVLADDLREEALAQGLPLEGEELTGAWRETSLWCNLCGKRKLVGVFEPGVTGQVAMRLRCPGCSPALGDISNSAGMIPLAGCRSFRPALKRMLAFRHEYYIQWQRAGEARCVLCGRPTTLHVVPVGTIPVFGDRMALIEECERCAPLASWAATACWFDPGAQAFMDAYPRWIMEPDAFVAYQGSPAIRFTLADPASGARLRIFAHPRTLVVLATAAE